jgi:hypothetical protein
MDSTLNNIGTASDGGKAKIPALKVSRGEEEVTTSTNDEKSAALAKGFFP